MKTLAAVLLAAAQSSGVASSDVVLDIVAFAVGLVAGAILVVMIRRDLRNSSRRVE